jgi:hypothetical protein
VGTAHTSVFYVALEDAAWLYETGKVLYLGGITDQYSNHSYLFLPKQMGCALLV